MTIWVDGAFLPAEGLPLRDAGAVAPFETMGAAGGDVPLWRCHMARLAGATARLGLPFAESQEQHAAARELLQCNGHTEGVLRFSLVPSGGRVRVLLASRARGPQMATVRLVPTVVARPAEPPGDMKVMPRAFYDAVRQQAQDGGADDGIVIGADGTVHETAVGNLWLRVHSIWVTPALDGSVLPGIARARLLLAARREGLPVLERRCDLGDVHRAEALAHTNAVYGPRTAVLLGSAPPAVRFVDSELVPLWLHAAAD